jgi:redox-sensitive bicupin YhaK (pirin superfamily)
VHFLQIWILPEREGLTPGYEQRAFSDAEKRGRLRLVASRDGRDGSVTVHQDVALYATVLGAGDKIAYDLAPGRHAWVQVARGQVRLNGELLKEGDGAAIEQLDRIELEGATESETLLFDLA